MSDQVTLSAYADDIRAFIQAGQCDEAIALCQHILHYYPKHIDTYRLLAEANLKSGDLESAQELYRRVLGADPENAQAYSGLAYIFGERQQKEEALWHLERAYEIAPTNPEIRKELLRVYSETDGGKPRTRLKLTPGGLARMYVQEGLFHQAIQEFRAIVTSAPNRFDARVALAEALWHAGRVREAADTAQALLESLPYCLKANLILGTAWKESGLKESETYLQRAQALDPTNRVAKELFGMRTPLELVRVVIPRHVPGEEPPPMPKGAERPAGEESQQAEWLGAGLDSEDLNLQALLARPDRVSAESEDLDTSFFAAPGEMAAESPAAVGAGEPMPEAEESRTPFSQEAAVPAAQIPDAIKLDETIAPMAERQPETRDQVETGELPSWLTPPAPTTSMPKPTLGAAADLPPWLVEPQREAADTAGRQPERKEQKTEEPGTLPAWLSQPSSPVSASAERGGVSPETQVEPEEAPGETSELPRWLTEAQGPASNVPLWLTEPPAAISPAEASGEPAEDNRVEIPAAEGELPVLSDHLKLEAESAPSAVPSETSAAEKEPAGEAGQGQPEIEATQVPMTEQTIEPVRVQVVEPAAEAEEIEQVAEPVAELPTAAQLPPSLEEPALEFSEPEWERAEALRLATESEAAQRGTEIPAIGIPQPAEAVMPPAPKPEPAAATSVFEIAQAAQPAPPIPSAGTEIPTAGVEIPGPAEAVEPPALTAKAELETPEAAPPAGAPAIAAAQEPAPMPPSVPPARQRAPEAAPEPPAPAIAELPGPEQLAPTARPARRRRDPLGGEHLAKARAHCEANRVEQALPEYDYIVQRAPRLVNEVIQDLEELVQRGEVPLEAHRILGDAYTRVDRLAEALERYRFVLDRVS